MKIVALAGGVGGAKLAHGLAQILQPDELTIVVNTGDDFVHLGLYISPDLDTVCYTLAGLANPVTGWGRSGESWQALENLKRLGGPGWFNVGDQDMGTHLERTRRLANGERLSTITRDFCAAWNVRHPVLPATDDRLSTWVNTVELGWLPFQEYFVRELCRPRVKDFRFEGCELARPAPGVLEAVETADWVVFCPSNPWVSIGPILAVEPLAAQVTRKPALVVSPIVGGKAIKGPAAKMYAELGIEPSALAVARHYQERLGWEALPGTARNSSEIRHVIVIDTIDAGWQGEIGERGMSVAVKDIVMKSADDRRRLADEIINLCRQADRRYAGL
jgi:LPPG:FO 2-phospho-L-lactate transferase